MTGELAVARFRCEIRSRKRNDVLGFGIYFVIDSALVDVAAIGTVRV